MLINFPDFGGMAFHPMGGGQKSNQHKPKGNNIEV
jgi:hypothetical protein